MYGIDLHKKAQRLWELYKHHFKQRLGEEPVQEDGAHDILSNLCEKVGYDRMKSIIIRYFQVKDDWVQGQGFSLHWLKNNINKVISLTASATEINGPKPVYVVNITESGAPVCSTNPGGIENNIFRVQLWDDWVRGDVEQKLSLVTTSNKSNFDRWFNAGNDVNMWVKLWHSNGWLQKEVKEIKPPSVI